MPVFPANDQVDANPGAPGAVLAADETSGACSDAGWQAVRDNASDNADNTKDFFI
jgi:hypothetical protein